MMYDTWHWIANERLPHGNPHWPILVMLCKILESTGFDPMTFNGHTTQCCTHIPMWAHICTHNFYVGFFLVMHVKGTRHMRLHRKACRGVTLMEFQYFISILHDFSPGIQRCTLFLHLSSGFLECLQNCVFVSLYCNVIWNFEMMKNNHAI
jgi:hypothetical protein